MTNRDQIQQLIEARTSANNHLAIELMSSLLNYSFEEAFAQLKLTEISAQKLILEISSIRIEYQIDFQEMLYVPATFADITRKIYYKDKLEPASTVSLHADEQSVFSLGMGGDPADLKEIKEDLELISPHIEALYELMQQGD